MAYRDDTVVLRETIDRLELSLARTTGKAFLLEEERDAARAELATLQGDPIALARARGHTSNRDSLFGALRVVGALLFATGIAPMLLLAFLFLGQGELALAATCGSIPWMMIVGVLALKLPGLVRWLELRAERKARAKRERDLQREGPKARVEVERMDDDEEVPVEAAQAGARRRGNG